MSPGPAVARGYGWQARVSYAIRSSLRPKQHVLTAVMERSKARMVKGLWLVG